MKTLQELLEVAVAHHGKGEFDKAASIYAMLLEKEPENGGLVYLLGSVYLAMGQEGLAITLLTYATKLIDLAACWSNLGIANRRIGNDEKGLECYRKALELEPGNIDALSNLSGYWVNQGNPDECIKWSDRCLAVDPENAPAASHRAIALLEKGDFKQGFKEYRSRYRVPSWTAREYGCPEWEGQKVELLAIHGEQGVGDECMFMSFVKSAMDKAENIVIECEPRLVPLFERSFGVPCYGTHDELMAAGHKPDAYCPMGTLPNFCEIERGGYLRPNQDRVVYWRRELEALGPGPYVGLSWKGGTRNTHMHLRNPGIEAWQQLVAQPCQFVSLQYGPAKAGAQMLGVPHWDEAVDSLDEMAALLKALDLSISVCNSSIHLAGAVGSPCWVATPKRAAWRYGLKGSSMPWYSSVKLYRQEHDNEWAAVFKQIGADLVNLRRLQSAEQEPASVAA